MPTTKMRAVLCKAWGDPHDLVVEEVPVPAPGPGEVRLAVQAAGVNFADTLMIAGKYQEKPPFPFVPGLEAAGVVDAVGQGVIGLKEGDRVMAVLGKGAFAEKALAPADAVFHIPRTMDGTTAAGFPVAYGTSHVALRHRAGLKAGETLLVHGAAGGVGLTAVQIGKVLGATVIGTARGAEKLDVAKANGAHHAIDYAAEDTRQRVLEITDKRGADVIYDPIGGDIFDASLRCIAWEGRLLTIGYASGRIPSVAANILLVKNASLIGCYWGAYLKRDPAVIRKSFEELIGWYGDGLLAPHISNTFELEQAADALETLLQRKSTGKVVLVTGITAVAPESRRKKTGEAK
jgi:NADPH2:quinone reductase